ncbi:TPR-like protein [Westerdykella ornata]|uniref:TPR-like protein n=1 Tax=Westerdykella ornata TaxID=318751 RepID=A0A6A6J9C5_WESOR|nr:TPR-like protein [Westerdykella ornata]KAF2272578.1 TPR-like protein [Westerdykella ornata]
MAKTKPQDRASKSKKGGANSASANGKPKKPKASAESLLIQAATFLQTSQPEEALVHAKRALGLLQPTSEPTLSALPALNLIGEIYVELGDPESAREAFSAAIALDGDGINDGAEKFLWLAQLNEEGGAESVRWFEKGIEVLKRETGELENKPKRPEVEEEIYEKKQKIAKALCGIAEVYMTDLSWEEDAEARCEAAVTEALLVAPNSPEPLQTLASIRLSQERVEDARAALSRSMSLWKDLDVDDPTVPDFPTRISLSRLLMEAKMEDEAIEVLERLIGENDSSVEAWYLGGWCLFLLAEKQKEAGKTETVRPLLRASRDWLENCLKTYAMMEYEDERLKEHCEELLKDLNGTLGPSAGEEEEEWEDTEGEQEEDGDEDSDAEMEGT